MALGDIGPAGPARVRRFRALSVLVSANFLVSAGLGERALAQDITTKEAFEEAPTRDISRDEWRERVAEAKRRAQQLAVENGGVECLVLPRSPTKSKLHRSGSLMTTVSSREISSRRTRACMCSRDDLIGSAGKATLWCCSLVRKTSFMISIKRDDVE